MDLLLDSGQSGILSEIAKRDSGRTCELITDICGTYIQYSLFDRRTHRENLPAVIHLDGGKIWWLNGVLHRDDDKPAVLIFGDQEWYQNGKQHRDNNRPAVIYSDGRKEWWVNDVQIK